MKTFTKDLLVGISVDLICNGIPLAIFIKNDFSTPHFLTTG
jgi:hypothetical protein